MNVTMSEYVEPTSSRRALSIAFQKARRRFPKNGQVSRQNDQSSDQNDHSSTDYKHTEDTSALKYELDNEICEKTTRNQVESSLVKSLEKIEISNKTEILCDHCQQESDDFETTEQPDITLRHNRDFVNNNEREPSMNDLNDSKSRGISFKTHQPNDAFYKNDSDDFRIIWGEEDICDNFDVNNDEAAELPDLHRSYLDRGEFLGPREKYRSKRQQCASVERYGACEECTGLLVLHTPGCPYYFEPCRHFRRHCCCAGRAVYCCCCVRRCFSCGYFKREERERSPRCCKSSRKRKSKRCMTCRRRIASRHPDTDSGVFTNPMPRYSRGSRDEDEDCYEDDEDEEGSCSLAHKDSLSILQEKYNGAGGQNGDVARSRIREDEAGCRRRKNRKRRPRYGNS